MSKNKPTYTGVLAKPLRVSKPVNVMQAVNAGVRIEDLKEQARAADDRERLRRFYLLFEHYGIARTEDEAADYACLALELAMAHVPGLQIVKEPPPRRGRPVVWSAFEYMSLIASIDEIKAERSCGDREACKIHLQRTGNRAPTASQIKVLNARLVDARLPQKNWMLRLAPLSSPLERRALFERLRDK